MSEDADRTRSRLLDALQRSGGNCRRAGEMLGVGRATVYRWLERFGIDPDALRHVGGRYEIQDVLGSGGQATVFRVKDIRGKLGVKALKLLAEDALESAAAERFLFEFRTLSLLRHPRLVRVFDFGRDETTGRPFIVMDLVLGKPFVSACAGRPPLWVARALDAALDALDHLHRHGLVHRDVTSSNVLVEAGEESDGPSRVVVMDLGLVESLSSPAMQAAGTGPYVAPEVLLGERATPRSDLFSIGVVAYRALTGESPHRVELLASGAPGADVDPAPSAARRRPGIPDALDRVVSRLAHLDPLQRYVDAASARADLAPLLGDAAGRSRSKAPAQEFVGREAEVAHVAAWARGLPSAAAGTPLLVVEGEAGMGKSRLLAAVVDDLRAAGVRVASATCGSVPGSALAPIAELFMQVLGPPGTATPLEEALRTRYARALAVLDPGLVSGDGAAPAGETSSQSRVQVFENLAAALGELVEKRPHVLVLDDVHVAEQVVLDLIWHVARRCRGSALRLLLATRPIDADGGSARAFRRGLEAESLADVVTLGPLGDAAVQALTAEVLGSAQATLMAESLWLAPGGPPLFPQQLLLDLRERGGAARHDARGELPERVSDVIRERLDRSSESEREVLAAMAVAGHPVRTEDLVAMLGNGAESPIERLIARRIVRRQPDGRASFSHALLRDEMLRSLDGDSRCEWHRLWAAHLERRGGDEILRAGHLLEAGAGAHAARDLLSAADTLVASWQFRAAIPLYEAAQERLADDVDARLTAIARLARASSEARDFARAARVCETWAVIARSAGRDVEQARALCALAAALREVYAWEPAERAAEQAVEFALAGRDVRTASTALKILATIYWETWRHPKALEPLDRACALAEESGDLRVLARNLHDAALPHALAGRPAAGLERIRRAQSVFDRIGDRRWTLLASLTEALIRGYLGDPTVAVSNARRTIEELETIDPEAPIEVVMESLLFLLNRLGRYTEAIELGQKLLDTASRISKHEARITGLLGIGDALFHLDEREAARDHHKVARELAIVFDESRQRLYAMLAIARDLREDRRLDAARAEASEVFEEASRAGALKQRVIAALELARIAHEEGDVRGALRYIDEADLPLSLTSEEAPALRAAIRLERARAWQTAGSTELALAQTDEGLGLARHHGPAEVEIALATLRVRLLRALGREDEALGAQDAAAAAIERVAASLHEPLRRARFLARPDLAPVLLAARRQRDARTRDAGSSALAGLYEVAQALSRGGDLDPVLERIVSLAVRETGAERGLLVMRDGRGSLDVAASLGLDGADVADALRVSRSALAHAEAGRSFVASDARASEDLANAASVLALGIRSVMCAPLRAGAEVIGCLYVDSRGTKAAFTDGDLRLLQALADNAALTVAYGRLMGRLSREREALAATTGEAWRFGAMVTRSPRLRRVFETLERVAESNVPVLILGESGTGKELAARALHQASNRRDREFRTENCAAIPESLLESILFGHVRGAFTGADRDRAGIFEEADGGSLLLDEIGEMSPALQAKLLRVLQEGDVRRVGGNEVVRCDVRVIAATHRDLDHFIAEGRFRADLYYRLNGITVTLPPLRERKEDIPLLVSHLLARECAAANVAVPEVMPSVLRALVAYDWPGNVRQLENVVKRMLLFSEDGKISVRTLEADPEIGGFVSGGRADEAREPWTGNDGLESEEARERATIVKALEEAGGAKEIAAALLGMSRATFYRRLRRYGL